jgi:hypothetical protein
VKTVSQSEAGYESVYQSSAVVAQWPLHLSDKARFSVALRQEAGRVREQ